jgi:large subunit ribosomal protein L37Ae
MARIVGSAGRFGVRYGKKIREAVSLMERKQNVDQQCPYCKKSSCKRLSKGVWKCKKCDKKFTNQTYYIK